MVQRCRRYSGFECYFALCAGQLGNRKPCATTWLCSEKPCDSHGWRRRTMWVGSHPAKAPDFIKLNIFYHVYIFRTSDAPNRSSQTHR